MLMAVSGLRAQEGVEVGKIHKTQADTIWGQAGKVVLLREYLGMANEFYLSANGKFIIGKDEDASFIYEIATGNSVFYDDRVVAEVKDFLNYVSSKSIVRNGVEINYNKNGLACETPIYASEDLNTIVMGTHINNGIEGQRLYTMVVFDGNGQLIDTMPHYESALTSGHGSLLWGLSPDGQIGAGKSSVNGAFSNNSPALWDRTVDKTVSLGDIMTGQLEGSMYGVSFDGTLLTGDRQDKAIYVMYDREKHAVTSIKEILPDPGFTMSVGSHIEPGIVAGFDQREPTDVYGRTAWLYFINEDRKVSFNDYFTNLYGLNMEPAYPIFSPGKFTRDLRTMVGTTYDAGAWLGYVVFLDPAQIYAMPRSAAIRQIRGTVNVEIKWQAALKGEYTVKEYVVYCDSVAVTHVPAGATENYSYEHIGVSSGTHYYQVQAVYTDGGVSDYTDKMLIQIIGDGECLPVREISATVTYNRTVRVAWGMPSSIISKGAASQKIEPGKKSVMKHEASAKKTDAKYIAEGGLDRVSSFNTNIESASAAILVGDYIYVSDFRGNTITAFNTLNGAKETAKNIEGMGDVYDMVSHNQTFYSVGYSAYISEIRLTDIKDPSSLTLSKRYEVANADNIRGLSHIAYIEGEDGGADMLMAGSYNSLFFYKTDGSGDLVENSAEIAQRFDISNVVISGSAYYKGRLYLANQADNAHTPKVEVFDFKTGEHLFSSNIAEAFPEITMEADYPNYDLSAAGLTVGTLEDGTVVLEFMTQPLVTYNYLATVEIESSPDIAGYNVYRDGDQLNTELLESRHYIEDITEPGTYKYSVEVVSSAGYKAKSDPSIDAEVQIYTIGSCDAPKIAAIWESNKMAVMEWAEPAEATGLVGFNIYRDHIQIAKEIMDVERFVDQEPGKGEHVYHVEAFYDNSCVAADSARINITFEGKAMPPAAVQFSFSEEEGKETNTHTTTWELPFFEEPMALGYGGTSVQSAGFDGTTTIYAVIGWKAADMGMFDDLYLVGMESVLGGEVKVWNAIVYVNDTLVYNQPINERQRPRQWVQTFLNQSFPMKQRDEIAVGYMVQLYAINDAILSFDAGPVAAAGKSDLFSADGKTFYAASASGANANLSINALVVRKRDLEQASKMSDPQAYIESKVMRFASSSVQLTEPQSIESVKTTSESYSLKGFNVYRDDQKVNDMLLTDFKFVETGMVPGPYTYEVSAVYADGQEEKSEPLDVNTLYTANRPGEAVCPVSFLPNPVQDMLYIKGEYASLSIIDMTGRVVLADVRNVQNLPMANFQSGIYFVKVTTENGQVYITKIVKK